MQAEITADAFTDNGQSSLSLYHGHIARYTKNKQFVHITIDSHAWNVLTSDQPGAGVGVGVGVGLAQGLGQEKTQGFLGAYFLNAFLNVHSLIVRIYAVLKFDVMGEKNDSNMVIVDNIMPEMPAGKKAQTLKQNSAVSFINLRTSQNKNY